ncbi:serine/threonine protein kinase [Hominisplanchenecus murintestinalis]|uniref:Serine/threonine protein kinase n=1 Tax=Hominisplanchenecus murintestinalis TaxID=2941517 RepID=A0AC61R1L2_9FIRM|nr:serine/threonine-protein kinase [Hominisplanchenecus murintestinalis]TGX98890.1 serine/threonine protein kinase [Hominisplanchenecus murintestinalis]
MATKVGTVLDGKYEILKQIGKGGMSIVYLAMDKRLNKQWAVKEIRKTASGKNNEVVVNSLLAEANLMKRLDHPALPRIVDIIDNGQTIYVIMDYIEGESLGKILKEYGAQPQEQVLDWAKQLCDVLEYLHSQKPPIIYRDMKPDNVMLKPEGNLKVIDFGIAREYKEKNLADTTILGTRGYAPPEQHGSRQTDVRSDIYALGMTMHHLLTGADPRNADYMYAPIRQWNLELSGGLERIIDKCTALDPEDRYQNCSELMYALEHYEEEDGAYKKKQKRKLASFIIAASMSVVLGTAGLGAQAMGAYEHSRDYEQMINISDSTPYDEKVQSYLEAIDLAGTDTRAYLKLLDAYQENGQFGDEESKQFIARYNQNREQLETEDREYLELAYESGITYFYLYSGGDSTFRNRALKAYPYFQSIVESKNTEYQYYEISQSYQIIGEFYTNYVVNATSVKEPTKEAYEGLLDSLNICIDKVESYDYDDAANIKLTMYQEIVNLLNDHRRGLASVKIDKNSVLKMLEIIREKTEKLAVTQQASLAIRDSILYSCEQYVENIERAYSNMEERRQ